MASAGSGTTSALLFSLSAIVFLFLLLQAPAPGLAVADLLASALDRLLGGRDLMELATRRNMILLCHAILFLILRDAGVLAGAPATRRRSPPGEATATADVAQTVPARPHATRSAAVVARTASSAAPVPAKSYATTTSTVVRRRRPRNRPVVARMHKDVVAECRPAAELAATWAAPVLATGPPAQAVEEAAAVADKQIVLAGSSSPRNDDGLLDRHDRTAVVAEPLEHPTAIAEDGEGSRHRQIVAVADDDEKRMDATAREQATAGMEMELADDRTFEEFIESQRRKMRQESLQLLRCQYKAIATC